MTKPIPLGKREGPRLEFKGVAALQQPESIARAVVAMLNAKGGDVWIGLEENGGVATIGQPIAQPALQERRLRDYLIDTIEPSPTEEEIRLQQVPLDPLDLGGISVLQVTAHPHEGRRPYAFLRQGGRHFVIRVGDRVRPMTREEILGPPKTANNRVEETIAALIEKRTALQREDGEFLWLLLAPVAGSELALDIQSRDLGRLLSEPQLSGNRRAGWNFTTTVWEPGVVQDALVTDPRELHRVEIQRNGWITFGLPLEHLHWKGDDHELWPFTVLEFPISAMRLARLVYEGELGHDDKVAADLMLLGLRGWSLRPNSPGGFHRLNSPHRFTDATDLVWDKPLLFEAQELADEPDRCGYRLVERVYEAFGFRREAIPREFDEASGRLLLPE